jgi:F-box/leucine-rich repeat protein 2/20
MSPVVEIAEPTSPIPLTPFDRLPRELHLLVLSHLIDAFTYDYNHATKEGKWSAARAGSAEGKWVGEAAGLRAVVATARVSRK